MRALEIQSQGIPVAAHVQFGTSRPIPEPQPGELRVRTEASALNQLDLWVGRGLPGVKTTWPMVSGSDGVGIVESCGVGVSEKWIGQRVILNAAVVADQTKRGPDVRPAGSDISMIGEHVPGTHAEFFCAPASNLLTIGDADPIAAAAFGLVHLTAWRMLKTRAQLAAGSDVLVTGIGGGVALACLQIALFFSCRVIVTSRSQAKLDRALAFGASVGILDEGQDFSRDVRAATGKRGVDVCADSIGHAVFDSCIKSLAREGVYVTCGCTSGSRGDADLARIFWNQLSVLGSTMGSMDDLREVLAHFKAGRLEPCIDEVYPASDGAAALARLESGQQFGKLVLDWRVH